MTLGERHSDDGVNLASTFVCYDKSGDMLPQPPIGPDEGEFSVTPTGNVYILGSLLNTKMILQEYTKHAKYHDKEAVTLTVISQSFLSDIAKLLDTVDVPPAGIIDSGYNLYRMIPPTDPRRIRSLDYGSDIFNYALTYNYMRELIAPPVLNSHPDLDAAGLMNYFDDTTDISTDLLGLDRVRREAHLMSDRMSSSGDYHMDLMACLMDPRLYLDKHGNVVYDALLRRLGFTNPTQAITVTRAFLNVSESPITYNLLELSERCAKASHAQSTTPSSGVSSNLLAFIGVKTVAGILTAPLDDLSVIPDKSLDSFDRDVDKVCRYIHGVIDEWMSKLYPSDSRTPWKSDVYDVSKFS
jgi:hypothetical protein